MRIRITMLIGAIRELAKFGPMKPTEEHGLDEVSTGSVFRRTPALGARDVDPPNFLFQIKETYEGAAVDKGATYAADPSGMRTGNGPGPQLVATLERVCQDASDALSPNLVRQRVAVSLSMLEDKLANCRGAVMMAYPMGLPAWDPVALCLEGVDGLDGTQAAAELLEAPEATIWVASKDFPRGQKVGDRLGWNEKTKVVAKLQREGSGPPAREPAVSEEERKAMMAHYFKRQEELKALANAEDDDYLASQWADPKAMQRNLRGQGSVKAPGLRL